LYRVDGAAGRDRMLLGVEHMIKVIEIDQAPIGRTAALESPQLYGCFCTDRELFSIAAGVA